MPILQRKRTPSLPKAPPKPLPRIPTAVQSRRGNLPQPVKETVPFVMPMGQTIQVPIKGKGVLGEAFDQNEDYYQKFKKGNIGGGIANLAGSTPFSGPNAIIKRSEQCQ